MMRLFKENRRMFQGGDFFDNAPKHWQQEEKIEKWDGFKQKSF